MHTIDMVECEMIPDAEAWSELDDGEQVASNPTASPFRRGRAPVAK
jgi:hypothetical protein